MVENHWSQPKGVVATDICSSRLIWLKLFALFVRPFTLIRIIIFITFCLSEPCAAKVISRRKVDENVYYSDTLAHLVYFLPVKL